MKLLDNLIQNKKFVFLFCFILIFTLILSFINKINLSNLFGTFEFNEYLIQFNIYAKNGGAVSDLGTHWRYILSLRQDFSNLLSRSMGFDTNLMNFPLHNIIVSQLYFLADNIRLYLISFFCFSLIVPYLFYLCLKEKFPKTNNSLIIIFASLIYIFPIFQFSAIWGSSHITSLVFFLLGILFHLKLRNSNYKNINNLTLSIFFLSLAAYTRQYYALFFFYIFFEFFLKLKLKLFFKTCLFTFCLAVPGILFLLKNPLLFTGYQKEITNFGSSILISSSICFFYLVPFIIQYHLNNFKNFNIKIYKVFKIKEFTISLIIFLICLSFFYYQANIGGGLIYKLSVKILNQKIIFFLSSFLGIYYLLIFTEKKIYNYLLTIILLTTFSTGYFIFQKYFEPMFLMIFMIYFNKVKIENFLNHNYIIWIIYFLFYYSSINYVYFFGL